MMHNSVLLKDNIADLKIGLYTWIYSDPRFFQIFHGYMTDSGIPILEFTPNLTGRTISIVINRNRCSDIPGFSHKKEYYTPIINIRYVETLMMMSSIYRTENQKEKAFEINFIDDILAKCRNGNADSFLLFDVTPILDNTILIYL